MAKTIPQLDELTVVDENSILPVDSGIQTFRITVGNLFKSAYNSFVQFFLSTPQTSGFTVLVTWVNSIVKINTTGGAFNIQLPNPALFQNRTIYFKDIGGLLSSNPATVVRFGTEKIEEVTASYLLQSDFGVWGFYCDGTDWSLI